MKIRSANQQLVSVFRLMVILGYTCKKTISAENARENSNKLSKKCEKNDSLMQRSILHSFYTWQTMLPARSH